MRKTGANVLVFDVGGTHASAALASMSPLCLRGAASFPVNSAGTADEILDAFQALGRAVQADGGITASDLSGISLGVPNPFDYAEGVSYMRHKYDGLYGVNLKSELARRFGVEPSAVVFLNDASANLLGEIHCGEARDAERAIGITLGTGVGSAFAVQNQIVTAGEDVPNGGFLWNVPYKDGIVEDFVSTRAIQGLFRARTGKTMEVREIAGQAPTNRDAADVMREFGSTLGAILKDVCSGFRPDTVVLGGAISRSAQLFLPAVEEQLANTGIRMAVSKLFDDASLLGAAVAWKNHAAADLGQ